MKTMHLEPKRGSERESLEHAGRGEASMILLPVLIPRKGELVDNLHVYGGGGTSIPILSYRQYLQLVARVLRTLLHIAYKCTDETLPQEALDAERIALSCVMKRSGEDGDRSGVIALQKLVGGSQVDQPTNPGAIRLAAQVVERLTSHYAIVAAVDAPEDGRAVISYTRYLTPTLDLASRSDSGLLSTIKGRARLWLSAKPVDISISLENASTAQSYHLVVDGQDGVFVGTQSSSSLVSYYEAHAAAIAESRTKPDVPDPAPPPYFRFKRRAGQRYAHFYARFFPPPMAGMPDGEAVPSIRFRFYEVPPGSIFRAFLAASASAVLIWLVGFVITRNGKGDPGTDVPAFLLVFPAVAAAWLGFDRPSSGLLEGTLAARLSLIVSALCSIFATGLFMLYRTGLPYMHEDMRWGLTVLGVSSFWWSLLTVVSILNCAASAFIYLMRTWEFAYLSARHDRFGKHMEHLG